MGTSVELGQHVVTVKPYALTDTAVGEPGRYGTVTAYDNRSVAVAFDRGGEELVPRWALRPAMWITYDTAYLGMGGGGTSLVVPACSECEALVRPGDITHLRKHTLSHEAQQPEIDG